MLFAKLTCTKDTTSGVSQYGRVYYHPINLVTEISFGRVNSELGRIPGQSVLHIGAGPEEYNLDYFKLEWVDESVMCKETNGYGGVI
jgi:hypothetical protein